MSIPAPWNGAKVLELVSRRTYTKMVSELHLAPLEAVVLKATANLSLPKFGKRGDAVNSPTI